MEISQQKRKVILLLLFILLIFYLKPFLKLLGRVAQLFINLSTSESIEACARLSVPDYITTNVLNLLLVCENCGSKEGYGYAEIYVLDSEDNIKFSYFLQLSKMGIGEERYFNFTIFLEKEGVYKVITRCYINEFFTESSKEVYFFIPPSPPSPPITPPPGPGLPPPSPNFTISYPKTINLTEGEEFYFFVDVLNTGNVNLHNVTLNFPSFPFIFRVVYPWEVAILAPGEETSFVVMIRIPLKTKEGLYNISFNVSCAEISKAFEISVNIANLTQKELVEKLIEKYSRTLLKLKEEIDILKEEGKNTSYVERLLDEVNLELKGAKELFDLGMYEESLEKIENVKKLIGEIAIEISRLKMIKIPKKVVVPAYIPYLLILIIVILGVVAACLMWKLRKRYEIGIKLRRFRT